MNSAGWLAALVAASAVSAFLGGWLVRRAGASVARKVARGLTALESDRPVRTVGTFSTREPWAKLARAFDAVAPRLQSRLRQLEGDRQQLRAVLEGMAEGVIAVDGGRRLLFANSSAQRLFGLGPGAEGRLLPELIRSPSIQEAVDATLGGPSPHRGEIALASRDVVPRLFSRTLAVHGSRLAGPPPGALLVFHDITEIRRLEQVRRDFVANVSHELKTPLAGIKAYTETLLEWALRDPEYNERYLRQIDEHADRLDQLIKDLLQLARAEDGRDAFELKPLLLVPKLREIVERHRERSVTKGLFLELDVPPGCEEARANTNEEAVRQVFDNLIDNAIKYTLEPGGRVRVSCRTQEEGMSRYLAVEVADTGIGIPRDELDRIFERFYRVDKARSRELGGTGLGLSIVKHLVQTLGGTIQVASRVGAGSRFTVTLPLMNRRSSESDSPSSS